ncbi:hypothetical protein F3Y22_tig00113725pilonHSYRG01067 [Hibiscus syriacus]|uniref:Reverse transcriptase zinc-binding domain-containing protein n=1 Tax=Hibiscus syriacus TaxID=106335 RepID=A0A6A2WMU6_HIBSY|nr:hypothetical protein F3Y22_tig00113725pilonHSYRG01067 [Hibiscus syriacus]
MQWSSTNQEKLLTLGTVIDGKWSWNIELRRSLFEWENQIWVSFLENISSSSILSKNGLYHPKSFCELVTSTGSMEDKIWKFVWAKLAPPKVEAFI